MGHHHNHTHDLQNQSERNIAIAFFLNFAFTIIEIVGGLLTNSTAILADAVHDLGDTLAIALSWVLQRVSKKQASTRFSYGYRRLSLLAAFINASILLIGSVWILSEAIPRLFEPQMPVAEGMIGLAILGIFVNGFAAWRLQHGQSMNEKVLNWHLLEDVLGWVAVLIVSLVLLIYPLAILDPLLSIGFTLFILLNVFKNLKQTVYLFLQSVPSETLYSEIEASLKNLPHVADLHHLHLWSLDGEKHVLTAHLELNAAIQAQQQTELKTQLNKTMAPFNLAHTTIEFEFPKEECRDAHQH
ncbi:cation diffusion facilitator family transporter [Catenovulum sediminis]|uniref:Cation diffusion facilitator family transporter n=1 Tax=Catenovulum sediminis TaxID=1740262 RepID=A0ABV1RE01_9ALTE|nr:cation diffusion facilitator family transporter [Catenovulum sediminis]